MSISWKFAEMVIVVYYSKDGGVSTADTVADGGVDADQGDAEGEAEFKP